jgi:hypothetical protein
MADGNGSPNGQQGPTLPSGEPIIITAAEIAARMERDGFFGFDGKLTATGIAKCTAAQERRDAENADRTDEDEDLADLEMAAMVNPLTYADRLAAYLKGRDVHDDAAVARWSEIDRWAVESKLQGYVDRFCDGANTGSEEKLTSAVHDAAGLIGQGSITADEYREAFLNLFDAGELEEGGREVTARALDQAIRERAGPVAPPGPSRGGDGAGGDACSRLELADFGQLLSAVREEPIEWLAVLRMANGKMHLNVGPGGVGKSTFVLAKAAALTTGGQYPGGPRFSIQGKLAVLAAEDAAADTIKPRFVAAGGDSGRFFMLRTRVTTKDSQGRTVIRAAAFGDLDYWRRFFDLWKPSLLIADPIQAFMGRGVNDSKNNEVRDTLEPFIEVIREYRVAFEAITHTPKKIDSRNAAEMAINSVAYPNLSRVVHVHWADPDDPDHYIVTNPKMWQGRSQPPIGYRIEGHRYVADGRTIDTSRIVLDAEPPDVTDHELLGRQGRRSRGPKPEIDLGLAAEWLRKRLQLGPASSLGCAIEGDRNFGLEMDLGEGDEVRVKRMARIKWWRVRVLKTKLGGAAKKLGYQGAWFFMLPGGAWPPPAAEIEAANALECMLSGARGDDQ